MKGKGIELVLKGRIVPAPRPRTIRMKSKKGAWVSHTYMPKRYTDNQKMLVSQIKEKVDIKFNEPITVFITFYRTVKRGDIDNLEKSILDALQKSGVITNDSLVKEKYSRIIEWKKDITTIAIYTLEVPHEEN